MFRILFLKNDTVNSDESFIDSKSYEELNEANLKAAVKDAADWIVNRYNQGEKWTAEIVQVVSKLERTGGDDGAKKKT